MIMSTPAITFNEASKIFSDAQEKDAYISHSMTPTIDKKDSASLKEITALAQIAINGIRQQIQEKPENCVKLQAQALDVRDYLAKVKESSEVEEITHKIYIDLFTQVEAELKELAAIDDSIYQQELKLFSDDDLYYIEIRTYRYHSTSYHSELYDVVFQKSGIRSKKTIIRLVKVAAHKNGYSLSQDIHKFGIKDQSTLIEIAKLAVQNNGWASKYIQNYGIKDQGALIEIAKLAAQQDGGGVSAFIQMYGFTNQEVLVDIAKLAAQQNGAATSLFIQNYGIKDQSALIEIAKLAAQQDGNATSLKILNYGIKNEASLLEIFLLVFKNDPLVNFSLLENYNLSCLKEVNLSEKSSLREIQKAFRWPEEFSPLFKDVDQEAPNKEDIFFLIYLGCKLVQKTPVLKDRTLWSSIFKYKDQKMRYELADLAFALDETQAKIYTEFSSPKFLQLPALIYSHNKSVEEVKGYHALLKEKKEFSDGMMQKALLDALHPLIVRYHFKHEEGMKLLNKALTGNVRANLLSIQGIVNCGGVDLLKQEAQSASPDLDAAYQAAFGKAIPMKPIKDFSTKYERTFGRCALPSAPLIYAGKLRQLPKEEQELALPALGFFIHSVLEGNYKSNRYNAERSYNSHLEIIFDRFPFPSLAKDWPIDIEKLLEDYLISSTDKISFDPQHFLKEKIWNEKHLSKKKYPLLYQFLETKDTKIVKGLGETLAKFADSAKERARDKVNLRNTLSSLDDIEKKVVKDKLDIEKRNKNKAIKLHKTLINAKK